MDQDVLLDGYVVLSDDEFLKHRICMKILMAILSIVSLTFNMVFSEEVKRNSPVFLYGKSYFFDNTDTILKLLESGKFSSELSPGRFFPGTSVWVYLSEEELLKDTSRKFLLFGYQDVVDVYSVDKHTARLQCVAGKYLKKSKVNEQTGRYFVQLYSDATEIRDGYLLAYRKLHDTNHSPFQATLSNKEYVSSWGMNYHQSKHWMLVFALLSAGILISSIVIMLTRYLVTKELSNLYYALWMITFFLHFVFMYFQSVLNNENAFSDSLRFNLIVSHTGILWAIPFLTLSFKYFHVVDEKTKKDFDVHIQPIINHVIKICIAAAIVVIVVNYFTHFYALGSFIMQLMVGYIFIYIIRNEYIYRKKMTVPVTQAYTIIIKGGIVHILFFFSGYVIAVFDFMYRWGLGLEVSLTFAALLGFIVHNFIAFIAYNKRDSEIAQERNSLYARSVESELKVIQNSLNPHFIFNSLGLIDSMMLKNDIHIARKALFDFSDLLRVVIDKSSDKLIGLKEELRMVELYLNIEKLRSSNAFDFRIEIQGDMDIRYYRVLPMIVQPIVENAIKHGILKRKASDGGMIILYVGLCDNAITFEIEDNGIGYKQAIEGIAPDYYDRKHIGIEFTKRRIALLTGEVYTGEEIQMIDKSEMSNESGTIVKFSIPANNI